MQPQPPVKATRKRVPRACDLCRFRKVRCILEAPAKPCVNCKHNGKQCTFNRRHGMASRNPRNGPPTPKSITNPTGSPSLGEPSEPDQFLMGCTSPSTNKPSAQSDYAQPANQRDPITAANNSDVFSITVGVDANQYSAGVARRPGTTCHPDYSFLQAPDTKSLLPQDLAFLTSQGCFIVPHRAALDEFMQQYFLHVHPMLPILNEKDHWQAYNSQDSQGQGRMSILVLQGLLFVSSGVRSPFSPREPHHLTRVQFVSLETIKSLGFRTVHQAKLAFYRRAKLLYDFNCEKSSISIAQAALLLAQTHLIPHCLAGNKPLGSIWLGVAIAYARDAKAHCYFSLKTKSLAELPKFQKLHNTLKRLWWCCIICDRLLPLTSRQNIKITKSNFSFSGCPPLGSADLADESYGSDVYDPTTKLVHAEILSKLVDLCLILTDVLTVTSVFHNNPSWILSRRLAGLNDAGLCQMALSRWYSSWADVKSTILERTNESDFTGSSTSSITLFINLVEMYYQSARLSLCHYDILRCRIISTPESHNKLITQREELQGAAASVTDCLLELGRLGLTRWLPMTAIGCTAFPLALHMIDVELLGPGHDKAHTQTAVQVLDRKQQQVKVLLETMSSYRQRYYIADWVMSTICHVVKLASQQFPGLSSSEGVTNSSRAYWADILLTQPSYYLRLAMTVDLSISHGKLPDDSDFPPSLRQSSHVDKPLNLHPDALPNFMPTTDVDDRVVDLSEMEGIETTGNIGEPIEENPTKDATVPQPQIPTDLSDLPVSASNENGMASDDFSAALDLEMPEIPLMSLDDLHIVVSGTADNSWPYKLLGSSSGGSTAWDCFAWTGNSMGGSEVQGGFLEELDTYLGADDYREGGLSAGLAI
ncbi:Zn(2)-C6 fungal-type domain-containing protein [Fusarium sp. Ph1]|nr:Zn(2)-C6 fungal-type domain-containing protein [Fusarium sp. Ph1]